MLRLVRFALSTATVAAALGCGMRAQPTPAGPPQTTTDPTDLAKRYASPNAPAPRPHEDARRSAAPFPVIGTWVPSGWMGDAEAGPGALSRAAADDPSVDEWTYDPSRGRLRWAAVAYQCPEMNFGAVRGKDLGGKGYDRLTFKARSKEGVVRVVFKSGGHTARGAAHPASYEATAGLVSLSTEWAEVRIPLAGLDLSNCPVALVVVFAADFCPRGGTIQIRGIAFCGPSD